jgi:hypothetical protein
MQQRQLDVQVRQHVLPQPYEEWIRQSDLARRKLHEERVFQISRISPEQDRPLIIATCGKRSAQKFLAAVATQESPDQFRIKAVFVTPVLPGFER